MRRSRGCAAYAKAAAVIGFWLAFMSLPLAILGLPDTIGRGVFAFGVAMAFTGGMVGIVDHFLKG